MTKNLIENHTTSDVDKTSGTSPTGPGKNDGSLGAPKAAENPDEGTNAFSAFRRRRKTASDEAHESDDWDYEGGGE